MMNRLRIGLVTTLTVGLCLTSLAPTYANPTPVDDPAVTHSDPQTNAPADTPDADPTDSPSNVPAENSPSPAPLPVDTTPQPSPSDHPQPSTRQQSPSNQTPAQIDPQPIVTHRILAAGQSSPEISALKAEISRVFPEYASRITVDEHYTQAFTQVVKDLQTKNRIYPDGMVGLKTSSLLRNKGIDVWVLEPINSVRALSRGQRSTAVGYAQAWLMYTYPDSCSFTTTDAIFGALTQSCVKKVQQKLGLRATGLIDYEFSQAVQADGVDITVAAGPTIGSLVASSTQWFGATGEHITQLQRFLVYNFPQFGVYSADGKLGAKTTASLKGFQRLHGMGADGGYGKTTAAALREYGLDAWIVSPVTTNWPLVSGERGSYVLNAQTWLVRGFPTLCTFTPDGGFGPLTEQCVKAVQAHYGLPQSGKIDTALSAKLVADDIRITVNSSPSPSKHMFTSYLKNGSRGSAVTSLQVGLNKYFPEYAGFKADGSFGSLTRRAVQAFQRSQGIHPDGMVGLKTAQALREHNIPLWYIPKTQLSKVLKQGSTGSGVLTAELALTYLYPSDCQFEADSRYTAETTTCVKAVQRKLGIYPDGMIGAKTSKALRDRGIPIYFQGYFAPNGYLQPTDRIKSLGGRTNMLTYGMNGVKVRIAQRKLGIWGTMTLASVDSRMQNAVRAFQRRAGIGADGIVGQKTWNAMKTGYSWTVDQYQASPIGLEATKSQRIERMISYAMKQRGSSYTWGGAGPYNLGYDCSGLALQSLYAAGLDPQPIDVIKHSWPQYRTSRELYSHSKLKHYPLSQRRRGDLIFYKSRGIVVHVAIYLGNNQVVHTDYMGRPARVQHYLLNYGTANTAGDVVRPFP